MINAYAPGSRDETVRSYPHQGVCLHDIILLPDDKLPLSPTSHDAILLRCVDY